MNYIIGTEDYDIPGGCNRIKIGFAKDVNKRLKFLQMGSPVKLCIIATMPGDMKSEKALHKKFKNSRSHTTCDWYTKGNEWFEVTSDIINFINEIKSKNFNLIKKNLTELEWAAARDAGFSSNVLSSWDYSTYESHIDKIKPSLPSNATEQQVKYIQRVYKALGKKVPSSESISKKTFKSIASLIRDIEKNYLPDELKDSTYMAYILKCEKQNAYMRERRSLKK